MHKVHPGLCTIVPEQDCTGCCACFNACRFSAITIQTNSLGHLMPYIDADKCTGCGACQKSCPSFTGDLHQKTIDAVYAAWAKDDKEHSTSTSGGLASVLAKAVIRKGGVVYGCASLPKCEFKHIRITTEKEVVLLKGSKYVQSFIGNTYNLVKQDLKSGIKVLFIGTPCQVSGLKSSLRKDDDNLYTIDLVCHGVPSQQLLLDHIGYLGINTKDVTRVGFRNPEGYYLTLWKGDKIIYKKNHLRDLYYSGFNDALYFRESCVNCKFAKPERVGDFTLGDFHGLGSRIPFSPDSKGNISFMAVNTIKGDSLKSEILNQIVCYKRTIEDALLCNPQLRESTHRKGNYSSFVRKYSKYGYEKAAKSCLFVRRIKNIVLILKNML